MVWIELSSLKISSFLQKTLVIILKNHLDRARSQSISNSKQNLLHLRSGLLEVNGAAAIRTAPSTSLNRSKDPQE